MGWDLAPRLNPHVDVANPTINNAIGFKWERIDLAASLHPTLNLTLKVLDGLTWPGLPASRPSVPPVVREPAFWGNVLFFITCEYGVSLFVNGGQAMWAEKVLVSLGWGAALACLPTVAGSLIRKIWASQLIAIRPLKTLQPVAAVASVGQLCIGCWESAPKGWLLCDGRAVSRQDYSKLFEVIKTVYGEGDRPDTFKVPDLQALGKGSNGSGFEKLGAQGGHAQHVLLESEMPRHSHGVHDPGHAHNVEAGGRKFTAQAGKISDLVSQYWGPQETLMRGAAQAPPRLRTAMSACVRQVQAPLTTTCRPTQLCLTTSSTKWSSTWTVIAEQLHLLGRPIFMFQGLTASMHTVLFLLYRTKQNKKETVQMIELYYQAWQSVVANAIAPTSPPSCP